MPVLFIGHGSPMNAIEENEYSDSWRELGKTIPRPKSILCISAHWETAGTCVTASDQPPTIHDFGGFPDKLYSINYPAPGNHKLAAEIYCIVKKTKICQEKRRGFDHGCWTVLRNMYPKADIPVIQLSLDYLQPFSYHYDLARELMPLRDEGILICCSGNIVHNLRMASWNGKSGPIEYSWAMEADKKIKNYILNDDHDSLININLKGREFELSIPTPEHYLPLIYAMALKTGEDNIKLFNDKMVMGSVSMTSVAIGL